MRHAMDLQQSMESIPVRDALARILRAAREILGMEFAFISEVRDGLRIFKLVDSDQSLEGVLQVEHSDPSEDSYCQRVIDGRLPGLIQNAAQNEEACKLRVTQELPVGAHLSVPIYLRDGSVFGTFCCFSRSANDALTETDLSYLKGFSQLATDLLQYSMQGQQELQETSDLIQNLLNGGNFGPVYQPIFDLNAEQIVGYEALTRFHVASDLNTEAWFCKAREAGLATELETAAAVKALSGLDRLSPAQYLAINMSPETIINSPDLGRVLGDDLDRVVLEITEHEQIDDYAQVHNALAPYREEGLRLAVDDAGAGYASFRHILQLNPDIIKLDRSLIRGLDTDAVQLALTTAMVTFAKSTNINVVAEGIETAAELDILKKLEISLGQGYFLGMPGAL